MLILEDYLLLTLDDVTGKAVVDASYREQVAAGALLVELALLGRADLAGDGDGGRIGRIVVRDASPTGNRLLDEALDVVRSREGSKPKALVAPIAKLKPASRAIGSLAERGVLRREEGRVLGIFPTTRWPAADSRHEDSVRADLWRVLVEGGVLDDRTAALVAILSATGQAGRVLAAGGDRGAAAVADGGQEWTGARRRAVDGRAKDIARESWASEAVRAYVEEITAVLLVGATVAATAAATS
ncbi:GOLPH3/VPS74 family protein [Cellulosimicrobium protaetiae]|uniref:GPP34 family phosphoprotein n=1 Tax=Cellulosimicrobium protaetiae TaxID=2587808 RepID=A0A6M5UFH7_9MICO|nr:GPP34 family phosphoprotein [Cellulosimicrobium protaetiae]QJW35963.1 GPP34 family phosphoprotein [Cellulosimicrobium protaetiae]